MASLLNEPYCPPPMVFEKKQSAVPERAYLKKSAALKRETGGAKAQQTLKIVREAMEHQEVKFKQMVEAKDSEIIRHQEMLLAQKERMVEQEKMK